MKFAVVAAFVAVAYAQDEEAAPAEGEEAAPVSACAEECVGEGECCALDAEGAGTCAVVAEGDGLACEELAAAGGEGEGSATLFASVATVAVAASMMF